MLTLKETSFYAKVMRECRVARFFDRLTVYVTLSCVVTVEATTRRRITELQKYRQAGLRWLRSAKLRDKIAAAQQAGRPHLLNDVFRYIQVCD